MEVTAGARFLTSSGGSREYRMSMDTTDLIEAMGEERVMAMKPTERARQMRIRCDMYVVSFLKEEGEFSEEHANARLKELAAKL